MYCPKCGAVLVSSRADPKSKLETEGSRRIDFFCSDCKIHYMMDEKKDGKVYVKAKQHQV